MRKLFFCCFFILLILAIPAFANSGLDTFATRIKFGTRWIGSTSAFHQLEYAIADNNKTGCSAFDNDSTEMKNDCLLILSAAFSASAKDPIIKEAYRSIANDGLKLYEERITDPFARGRIKENYEALIKYYTNICNSGNILKLPAINYFEVLSGNNFKIDNEGDFSNGSLRPGYYYTKINKYVIKRISIRAPSTLGGNKITYTDKRGYQWTKPTYHEGFTFVSKGKAYNQSRGGLIFIDIPIETAKKIYNTIQEVNEYNKVNYHNQDPKSGPPKSRGLYIVLNFNIKAIDSHVDTNTHEQQLSIYSSIDSDIDFSIILADQQYDNLRFINKLLNKKMIYTTKAVSVDKENSPKMATNIGQLSSSEILNKGFMYKRGEGVAQNYAEALNWFKKAANLGDVTAMNEIGYMYHEGEGVAQNYAEALKWFKKAADLGDATAMTNIGLMYILGKGVAENYAEAMKWFKKAADLGNANAMYMIGFMYEKGLGMPENRSEAVRWYEKAAAAGQKDAISRLEQIK